MSNTTQKYLRFFVPGLLAYFHLYFYCNCTDFCSIGWPNRVDEVIKLTSVFVLSFLYYVTPLRRWFNHGFQVDANIMDRLKKPFLHEDDRFARIKWNNFKDIYYKIIDDDKSLSTRSENIRFNGTLWTSIADFRALLVLLMIASGASFQLGRLGLYDGFLEDRLLVTMFLAMAAAGASLWISEALTNRHRRLVIDQCEYILLHHAEALRSGLKAIAKNEP